MTGGLDVEIPRRNGEPVFDEPWQSRAFGMVMALQDAGVVGWDDFRERLVAAVALDPDGPYYERWLTAFEDLVVERGLLDEHQLDRRRVEFLAGERPEVF